MRNVVVYESEYGNTHLIAKAIAEGLRASGETIVVPVGEADAALAEHADLVVVGGPTHAHGMSRASTRKGAIDAARKPGSTLVLDDAAAGPGLREWFDATKWVITNAAAFDTRADMAAVLSGRASKGIAHNLRRHGATLVAEPESFFVTKENTLESGEKDRARAWGAELLRRVEATYAI
jgi:menaquinone-dependent protoporphyrinogen IX oxidase